ncbi:MAG: hypothetical protein ABS876_04210 [Ruminococcus sp.]
MQADYDPGTGYYVASFTSTKTGAFNAILAKDTSYTGQDPASGGYSGTLDTDYVFKTSGGLEAYTSQRCLWFIITEDWLKNNLNNNGDYMSIWTNTGNDMRKINDYAYVREFSSVSGTIYFQQRKNDNSIRNEWSATVVSDKSQYTESDYATGSWTN